MAGSTRPGKSPKISANGNLFYDEFPQKKMLNIKLQLVTTYCGTLTQYYNFNFFLIKKILHFCDKNNIKKNFILLQIIAKGLSTSR